MSSSASSALYGYLTGGGRGNVGDNCGVLDPEFDLEVDGVVVAEVGVDSLLLILGVGGTLVALTRIGPPFLSLSEGVVGGVGEAGEPNSALNIVQGSPGL